MVRNVDPQSVTSGTTREVAFIDTGVSGWDGIVRELAATRPDMDVVVLDHSDGLAQMAAWAATHDGYDAIHVISHGAEGELRLGNTLLNADALESGLVRTQLRILGGAVNGDGDILLYGCDTAEGAAGARFIGQLAQITGADVAASTDPTGAASAGGEWVLEAQTGAIEAPTLSLIDFSGTLDLTTPTASISLTTDSNIRFGSAVGLAGDRVAFETHVTNPSTLGGSSTSDATISVYNADGSFAFQKNLSAIPGVTVPGNVEVTMLGLANGNIVVEYNSYSVDPTNYTRHGYFVILDPSGDLVTGPVQFNQTYGSSLTRFVSMDELSNSNFVIGYQQNNNQVSATRIFHADGTPVGNETVFSQGGSNPAYSIQVEKIASGYAQYTQFYQRNLLQFFDNGGVQQGATITLSNNSDQYYSLFELSDGNLLVTEYHYYAGGGSSAKLYDGTTHAVLNADVDIDGASGYGNLAVIRTAGDAGYVTAARDAAWQSAYDNRTDFSGDAKLLLSRHGNDGAQHGSAEQAESGFGTMHYNSSQGYHDVDTTPRYVITSGYDGGLIAVETDPAENQSTYVASISARLFEYSSAVNTPPEIGSDGGGDTASVSVPENRTAVTTVAATDAEGDTLTYTIVGGADQAKFQINQTTGALSFRTLPNFEAPRSAAGSNAYVVQVAASDGTASDTQTITVNVTNVAETPLTYGGFGGGNNSGFGAGGRGGSDPYTIGGDGLGGSFAGGGGGGGAGTTGGRGASGSTYGGSNSVGAGGAGATSNQARGGDGGDAESGGGGGGGAHGGVISASTTVTSVVSGSAGGQGGDAIRGGGGGAGGFGVVLNGTGLSVTFNPGSGASGADGGAAGGLVNGPPGSLGRRGSGGDGGLGVYAGDGNTLVNSGTITGGKGGDGTGNVQGGAGVVGSNLTLQAVAGSIVGGLFGDGTTRADAVTFIGGANSLTLGGTLSGNIGVNGTATTLTVLAPTSSMHLSNAITGTGSVTFSPASAANSDLTLDGTNTYSGSTTIQGAQGHASVVRLEGSILNSKTIAIGPSGLLVVENGQGLATTAAVAIATDATSGLNLSESTQIGSLNGGGSVGLANGSILTTGTNNTSDSYGGIIGSGSGGDGGLTKVGTGTFTLTGANGYTGVTTISGGTLKLGGGGTTGSIDQTSGVIDNARLAFDRSDAMTLSAVISGTGTVAQVGMGTTLLSAGNSYQGGTALTAGTLALGTLTSAGSGAITFGIGAQTLRLDVSGTLGNTLTSFGLGDKIDLRTITFAGATMSMSGNLLTVTEAAANGTDSNTLTLGPAPTGYAYKLASDGAGGTSVTLAQPGHSAPTTSAGSATFLEDATYTFKAADFPFADAGDSPADSLSAVIVTALPATGTLAYDGTAITSSQAAAGFSVTAADIGKLTYRPAANGNGSGYASFQFKVQDDSGTANDGSDTSAPATFTLNVTSVNDAPTAQGGAASGADNTYIQGTMSASDVDGPNPLTYQVVSNPYDGTLSYNPNDGSYRYASPVGYSGTASFTFRATDGLDYSNTATVTITVNGVNHAPTTSAGSATLFEDATYTFKAADFPFGDAVDTPADHLSAVIVTSLPGAGTLAYDGSAITAQQAASGFSVAAADIGKLSYKPATDGNGTGYASFQFKVQDDGGTANGGSDTSAPATFTLNVTAVNDPPTATNLTQTVRYTEDAPSVALGDIVVSDTDTGDTITATLTLSDKAAGMLTTGRFGSATSSYSATTGIWTVSGSKAEVNQAIEAVSFTPAHNFDQDTTITARIRDAAGTGPADGTITLDVSPVNDPPTLSATGADTTYTEGGAAVDLFSNVGVSTVESGQTLSGAVLTVTNVAADGSDHLVFGGLDVPLNQASTSAGADGIFEVRTVNGTATVTFRPSQGGQYTEAQFRDLIDGLTYYSASQNPSAGPHVVTLTSLTDNGGTANGGRDTTSLSVSSTVTVTPVNDAPTAQNLSQSLTIAEDDSARRLFTTAPTVNDVDSTSLTATLVLANPNTGTLSGGGFTATGAAGTYTFAGNATQVQSALAAVTFDSADNVSGTNSVSVAISDGNPSGTTGTQPSGTVNISITAVNDDPRATGVPSDVTVTSGTPSNVDLSPILFSDVDSGGANVTFTIKATAGTLSAASGGSVTVTGAGTGTLTLTGLEGSIDTFLNDPSHIKYTSAANALGDNAATLTLTADDGGHTGTGGGRDVTLGTVHLDVKEAPSLVVTTLADTVDAYDGKTSLREAVAYANEHAGADTITFAASLNGTIRLDGGDGAGGILGGTLSVAEAVTIDGGGRITLSGDVADNDATRAGTDITDLTATSSTNLADNVRLIDTASDLTLKGLTLTGGYTAGKGGAVNASGRTTVTVEGSTVAGNGATGDNGYGGGICGSTINATGSTFGDNHAGAGGGGIIGGTVSLTNATVSGNSAVLYGGGLSGVGVTLTNTTVTGNVTTGERGYGGGVYAEAGATITNSIVLGNVAKAVEGDEVSFDRYTSVGGNIIGRDGGGGADVFSGATDVGDTDAGAVFAQTVDIGGGVRAGVLADNGGKVQTVALRALATNPALDAADASAPATDARGFARVDYPTVANGSGGSGADLGAYELQGGLLDTTPPTITIGPIAGDDVVNAAEGAATITVSGTAMGAEDGQTVRLALKTADGSSTLKSLTTTVSGGVWHIDLPPGTMPAFPDGRYRVTADVSDAAGNPATEATRTLTVDTTADGSPAVSLSVDATADGVINAAEARAVRFTVAGLDTDATATAFFSDGTRTASAAVSADGTATIDLSGFNGTVTSRLSIADIHQNAAAATGNGVRLDTVAPAAPVIISFADNTGSTADTITSDATPTLTLTAEAGAQVVVLRGGSVVGSATETATPGTYTFTSAALGDGTYSFTAMATDAAGNPSPASAAQPITVDAAAPTTPAAPVLTQDTGTSASDRVTANPAIRYATPASGDTLLYSLDGATYTATAPTFAADGTYTVSTKAADAAGNLSGASSLSFTLDRAAPAVPAGLADAAIRGGYVNAANNTAAQTLTGTAEPGSTVTVYDGARRLGTAAADPTSGAFGFTLGQLAEGSHSLTATATDAAGNLGPASAALSFVIDTLAPGVPGLALTRDTGISGTDRLTNDARITVTTAEAGGTLAYRVDGGAFGAGYDPAALADGAHTLAVTQTDAAGNISAAGAISFTLDRTAPVLGADAAAGTGIAGALAGRLLANDSDAAALHLASVRFSGSDPVAVPASGSVQVLGDNGLLTVSADGSYRYQPSRPGGDSFTETVADAAGNTGQTTLSLSVTKAPIPASLAFAFAFTDATFSFRDGHDLMTAPDGSLTDLTGVGTIRFSDGTVQENDGSPLVDDLFYYATNRDVWAAHVRDGVDADQHYAAIGWREGRDPDAIFSTKGYLAANPDVKAAGIDPLAHYDAFGWHEGRSPGPAFSAEAYLFGNADVAKAGLDPLAHYLQYGQAEGRPAFPGESTGANGHHLYGAFDASFYLAANPDVAQAAQAARVNADSFAFTHYLTSGAKEGRDPDAYFSTKGYLAANPDVAAAGVDPLLHYEQYGWREGRDPGPAFHTDAYLAANPDVAAAHIDPLQHYLQYGIAEERHLA